jgi:hypothetical protein
MIILGILHVYIIMIITYLTNFHVSGGTCQIGEHKGQEIHLKDVLGSMRMESREIKA